MEDRVKKLETEVQELKSMLTLLGMPYDLKEIIRNEVILGPDSTISPTQTIETPSAGDPLLLPIYPTLLLTLQWRGRQIKVLAVE